MNESNTSMKLTQAPHHDSLMRPCLSLWNIVFQVKNLKMLLSVYLFSYTLERDYKPAVNGSTKWSMNKQGEFSSKIVNGEYVV